MNKKAYFLTLLLSILTFSINAQNIKKETLKKISNSKLNKQKGAHVYEIETLRDTLFWKVNTVDNKFFLFIISQKDYKTGRYEFTKTMEFDQESFLPFYIDEYNAKLKSEKTKVD